MPRKKDNRLRLTVCLPADVAEALRTNQEEHERVVLNTLGVAAPVSLNSTVIIALRSFYNLPEGPLP